VQLRSRYQVVVIDLGRTRINAVPTTQAQAAPAAAFAAAAASASSAAAAAPSAVGSCSTRSKSSGSTVFDFELLESRIFHHLFTAAERARMASVTEVFRSAYSLGVELEQQQLSTIQSGALLGRMCAVIDQCYREANSNAGASAAASAPPTTA
jgi:hypothetical protein